MNEGQRRELDHPRSHSPWRQIKDQNAGLWPQLRGSCCPTVLSLRGAEVVERWRTWFISSDSDIPLNLKRIDSTQRLQMLTCLCPFSKPHHNYSNQQVWDATLEILRYSQSFSHQSAADPKADESSFSVPGLSPCNLEVQTVTLENRKTSSGAHLKTSSVWGLQCRGVKLLVKMCPSEMDSLTPVWTQKGSLFPT